MSSEQNHTEQEDQQGTPAKKGPQDLTSSIHDPEQDEPTDPVFVKTKRLVIRFGTIFFGLAAFLLFLPMIIGVGQGIRNNRVWDPYTGKAMNLKGARLECVDEAQRLMMEAGRYKTLKRVWAEPYRDWSTTCKKDHKELYELLTRTRLQLKQKTLFVPKVKK